MLFFNSQSANDYINAVKELFGQVRNARNKIGFFTARANDEVISVFSELFQDMKLLDSSLYSLPDNDALDSSISSNGGVYQIWLDANGEGYTVSGDGVLGGDGVYFVPSGVEVTVSQNGGTEPPSAENFIAHGDPAFMYISAAGDAINTILPYRGKLYMGTLSIPEDNSAGFTITLGMFRPDGTFHYHSLIDQAPNNHVFIFTHIFFTGSAPSTDVCFCGKEMDFVADGYTEEYVAPTFIYVPD